MSPLDSMSPHLQLRPDGLNSFQKSYLQRICVFVVNRSEKLRDEMLSLTLAKS